MSSGRSRLDLPQTMFERIWAFSVEEGLSLNAAIVVLIGEALDADR